MIKDAMANAQQDNGARRLAEQKVEAARVLESLHAALNSDGDLLSPAEREEIDAAVSALSTVAEADDPVAIEDAIKTLDRVTQDFAARRMDSSIRRALAGHSVDEV